jgi:Xaa-Pro dipeptidase
VYGDHEDSTGKLLDLLGEWDVLGVEKDRLTLLLAERILAHGRQKTRRNGPCFEDISGLLWDLRVCKNPEEIEKIETAVGHGDEILEKISKTICIGRSQKEIAFEIFQEMSTRSGVSFDSSIVQVLGGVNSSNPHGTSGNRQLEKGDPLTIDFGVYYDGYWSDLTRTFFVGPPDPRLEEIYHLVLQAQQAAIDTVRPGIPMQDIDQAARQVIEKAGYGEFFIHRIGHGIGLDIHEPPSIHKNNPEALKENMVFTIEPGVYLPNLGGVRIEDDVAVTGGGARVMSRYPKGYEDMILPPGI